MTLQSLIRAPRVLRPLTLALVLALPLGCGLIACKKKPSADKKQSHETPAVGMDAMRAMDGMRVLDAMDGMRVPDAMETPDMGPDAGVVRPKGKGMLPRKQLEDHTK